MPDKPTVYIETSVVSYLVARPSRDVITLGRQGITQRWWETHGDDYRKVISRRVIDEVSAGDQKEAAKRIEVLVGLEVVTTNEEVVRLAELFVRETSLPTSADSDAMHIAAAVVNGIQYLLTWNHKHMANAQIHRKINEICEREGYEPTLICTPEALDPEEDPHAP